MGRLFRLIYLLMERGAMTAGQLAEALEVSVRTIYRDIDQLSAVGVPVFATQGKGGGIQIDPAFVLDRSLLSGEEQQELLAALQGYQTTGNGESKLLEKLSALFKEVPEHWIQVDFSYWGQSDVFERIKECVLHHRPLGFRYYNAVGEVSERVVEPVKLWFKHRDWYLWAFCRGKGAFRLFRLSRMEGVTPLDGMFEPKSEELPDYAHWETRAPGVEITLWVAESETYRVLDEFSEKKVEKQADGSLIVTGEFIDNNWLYGYLLSFGAGARVLKPERVRRAVAEEARRILEGYGEREEPH